MKTLAALGMVLVTGWVQAQVLYNNGPAVDANGQRVYDDFKGVSAGPGYNSAIADDFTVKDASGWNVTSLDFYATVDQNTPSDPSVGRPLFLFQDVNWSIVKGDDVNTGEIVASDQTFLTNGGLLGFNVSSQGLDSRREGIFDIKANIPDVTLDPGHYWLTWSFANSLNAIQAPVVGSTSGNAHHTFRSSQFQALDLEVPFQIGGTVVGAGPVVSSVPEPTTWAGMMVGLGLLMSRVYRRSRRITPSAR